MTNKEFKRAKRISKKYLLALAIAAAGMSVFHAGPSDAQAGPLYWSGTGTWTDPGTTGWGASGGPYLSPWADGSDAHFEGTAGTVTVTGNIVSVNSIFFDVNGYTLTGGTVTLTGAGGNITTASGGSDTIDSIIAGSVGLTKLGTGTLVLTAANTYTGGTTLSAGQLTITNNSSLGTGTLTLGGGTFFGNGTTAVTNNVVATTSTNTTLLGGSGGSFLGLNGNITGSGTITLSGSNGGNIRLAGDDSGFSGTMIVNSSGFIFLNAATTGSAAAVWQVDAGVTGNAGNGTFSLGALTSSTASGNLGNSGTSSTYSVGALNTSTIYAGTISGATALIKIGSGTLTLTNSGSYTNGTTLSAGQLTITNNSALGTGTLTLSGGTFFGNGTTAVANAIAVTAATTTTLLGGSGGSFLGLSGNISGSGTLTFSGSNGGNIRLAGNDSGFTGTAVFNASDFSLLNNVAAGSAAAVWQVDGGAQLYGNVNGGTFSLGALTSTTTTGILSNNASSTTYSVGALNTSTTYAGTIGGATALIKVGSGTLTLSNANSYSLGTTLSAGQLTITSNSSLGTGTLTLSGGTFFGNGTTAVANAVAVTAATNTTLLGGSGGGFLGLSGNITGSGTITLSGSNGGNIRLAGNDSGFTGTAVVNASAFVFMNNAAAGSAAAVWQVDGSGQITGNVNGGTFSLGALTSTTTTGILSNSTGSTTYSVGALNTSTTYGGTISGATALIKVGSGTLTLTNSNTYTNGTTISAGALSVNSVGAAAAAQPLGENATLTLAGGTLQYTGGSATLGKAITANTSTSDTISNTGGGTLTLSGGISKNGSTLTLAGGNFIVNTNPITGAMAGSDLIVSGSTVTLGVANTYNGPTSVVSGGKIVLGINNAIPSNSAVTLGDGFTTGALTMGSFTNSIGNLAFGAGTGTVAMAANQTGAAQLTTSGALNFSGGNILDLTGMLTAAPLYKLISGSSLTGTFSTVTGLNSNYTLRYGTVNANELDVQEKADQTVTGPIAMGRIIAGQSFTGVSLGTLNNTSQAGSSALAVSLSATDSGSPAGTFSSLAAASGSTLAAATSTNLTGNFTTTGSTALGTRNFTISNTDGNAVPTTASLSTGSVDVVTSRVITAGSVNFGRVILGSTGSAQSSALNTTGSFDTTANLTVNNGASGSSSGITASSGSAQLFNSAGSTGTLTVTNGTAFGSTGTQTGTVTLAAGTGNFTGELTGQTLGPIAVAYTIDPVNERTYASPGTVTLGNFLLNANEVVSSNQTITTTGLHDVTADATLGSSTSGTIDGLSLSGGPDFVNGSTTPVNLTRTITGTLATNSYGPANGTFNMNSVDEFANTITNAASVNYTANVGLATAALSDRGGTNIADRLAYQMTSTEVGSQTLFNGTVLTAVVGNTDSYAGLASKTIAGGTVLGTVATILAGTNQSGGTNTVSMTWRDRSTLERPGGSIPPLPATVGSPRYLISDVVLLTGMNSGAGSTLDTNHTIAGNPYTITNHQTDDFVLQMSYSGGANPTLDWLDPSDSYWKLANAGDFTTGGLPGGNDASGGELDFIGSFASFQSTYGTNLLAYLGAYGYDPTNSVAWAVINHNSQFAVVGEVPEPTSLGLLGLGAMGLLGRKRWNKW